MSGPLETSVTLDEVFAVVAAKRVPLAPELAGYLALEVAEGVDAGGGEIDPRFVFIGEEGTVALVRPRRDGPVDGAETSIRALLGSLLDASGSQTSALSAVARRRAGVGLPALVDELEAALIPVNRAAGRRALARLAREVKRVTLGVGRNASQPSVPERSGPLRPPASSSHIAAEAYSEPVRPPSSSASFALQEEPTTSRYAIPDPTPAPSPASSRAGRDGPGFYDLPTRSFAPVPTPAPSVAEVDELLARLDAPAPPPPSAGRNGPPPLPRPNTEVDIATLLAMSDPADADTPLPKGPRSGLASGDVIPPALLPPPSARQPQPTTTGGSSVAIRRPMLSDRQLPTAPSLRRTASATNEATRRRHTSVLILAGVAALIFGGFALTYMKPGLLSGRTPEKVERERLAAEAARQRILAANAAAQCKAKLTVTDVPAHAEVLLRVGQAPVDIERLPVGARLEFVATAEGYAAKRAVIPAGASWETGADNKPRFEVAVQLDRPKSKSGADMWPPGEPGSEVGGNGPPGTVHVVSSPKGAEIWLLTGMGPEATIEQLKCDTDVDVLVAGPTTFRKRLHVRGGDFARQEADMSGATRVARVSAK